MLVDFGCVGGVHSVAERFVLLLGLGLHHEEGDGILTALRYRKGYLFGGRLHDGHSDLEEARLPDGDDVQLPQVDEQFVAERRHYSVQLNYNTAQSLHSIIDSKSPKENAGLTQQKRGIPAANKKGESDAEKGTGQGNAVEGQRSEGRSVLFVLKWMAGVSD